MAAEAEAYAKVSALLEDTPLGVFFLDRRGAIASANQSAGCMLRAKDGIYEWRGTLRVVVPREDDRLRRLVASALPRIGHVPSGGSMSVRRSVGLPLIVDVHPVTPDRADFGAERLAALVLVRDPDANRIDPEMVGDVLGLTAAETRVAVLLGMGRSVREHRARTRPLGEHRALDPEDACCPKRTRPAMPNLTNVAGESHPK